MNDRAVRRSAWTPPSSSSLRFPHHLAVYVEDLMPLTFERSYSSSPCTEVDDESSLEVGLPLRSTDLLKAAGVLGSGRSAGGVDSVLLGFSAPWFCMRVSGRPRVSERSVPCPNRNAYSFPLLYGLRVLNERGYRSGLFGHTLYLPCLVAPFPASATKVKAHPIKISRPFIRNSSCPISPEEPLYYHGQAGRQGIGINEKLAEAGSNGIWRTRLSSCQ